MPTPAKPGWRNLPGCGRTISPKFGPAGLSRGIAYRNTKGEVWTSTVAEVLTHVVIHSGYHRGQIAAEIRSEGATPAYTDFIHAARQGLIE